MTIWANKKSVFLCKDSRACREGDALIHAEHTRAIAATEHFPSIPTGTTPLFNLVNNLYL